MAIAPKLSDDLVTLAKLSAAEEHRSAPEQVERWARIGEAVDWRAGCVDESASESNTPWISPSNLP